MDGVIGGDVVPEELEASLKARAGLYLLASRRG